MRAFVTGAGGFVGHAVCAELLARGHEVSALVRRPGSEPAGTTAVKGDLGHADPLTHALEVAAPDCVIHLAAEIATQRDEAEIEEVNVHGTSRLIGVLGVGKPRRVPLWLASLAGGGGPARAVVRSARSSNAHIKQELGWAPRFPSAQQGVPRRGRAAPRLTCLTSPGRSAPRCPTPVTSRRPGQSGRRARDGR